MGREYGDCRKDSDRIGEKRGTEADGWNGERCCCTECEAGVRGRTGRTLCQIGGADGCGQRPGIVREGCRCGPSDGKYNEDHDVYPCVGILAGTSGSDDRSIGSGCVPAEGTSWDAERGSVLHQRPVVFPDAGIA